MNKRFFPTVHIFVTTILFLCSCARLPIYESLEYATTESDSFLNPISSHFDEKFNVNYGVANNDSDLFIQAIFHDRLSYMQIMRGGLTVYFDPSGKKKKSSRLKLERFRSPNTNQVQPGQSLRSTQGIRQANLVQMISQTYSKVTWYSDGREFIFYRNLTDDPIDVDLIPNKLNELVMNIKIPLNEIPLLPGQNMFSLGIETGASTSAMGSGRPGGTMRSGGMGSSGMRGSSGAMRGGGGMRSGGMQSGRMSGGSRPGGGSPSGSNPIKIWFQVKL